MIEKMDMKSMDITEENVKKIQALFPNAVTEVIVDDKTTLKIDFDVLKQELSASLIEDKQERYQMTWPDKSKAKVLANSRITSTLRPDKEKSVDFDNTQNLYIEGDNLDILKLLRETYLGKVKMIYIDPPYNTGNDFVYNDDFSQSADEYMETSGQYDEEGNRLVKNLETNGRFHTDWLNMIYPRLKVAKDLLTDDGVIFISIDDNEQENLKKICDEIFGEWNFIATFFVASNSSKNNARFVSVSHEYMLCYSRNKGSIEYEWKVKKNAADEFENRAKQLLSAGLSFDEIHQELLGLVKYPRFYDFDHYTYADNRGVFRTDNPGGVSNGNFNTEIVHPITGRNCAKPSGGWRYKDEEIKRMVANDMFFFGEDETVIPQPKRYLNDYMYQVPKSLMFFDSQASTKWLKNVGIPFDFPKSIDLIKHIVSIFPKDILVLDFFSGSATTAHAVMQLNAEDGGNRKFIMVQLPEECDEKSEAYKAGYKTICEIGEERIRRAGAKIKSENPTADKLDTGFRVLKLDSSNMQDVYYNPMAMRQSLLDETIDNVKSDRTPLDLLFQVMLDLGVELSAKIEEKTVNSKTYFVVNGNDLIACFDEDIDNSVITEIAKQQPLYAVFKSTSFATDSASINNEQLFKTYSPATVIKVI